jgi:hypothetical protein
VVLYCCSLVFFLYFPNSRHLSSSSENPGLRTTEPSGYPGPRNTDPSGYDLRLLDLSFSLAFAHCFILIL